MHSADGGSLMSDLSSVSARTHPDLKRADTTQLRIGVQKCTSHT